MYLQCNFHLIEFNLNWIGFWARRGHVLKGKSEWKEAGYAIVAKIVFCKFYKSITRALLGALEEAWARERLPDFSYVRFTVILFLWSQMNWTKLFYFSRDDIFRDTVLVLPVQGKHSHIKVNSIIQLT